MKILIDNINVKFESIVDVNQPDSLIDAGFLQFVIGYTNGGYFFNSALHLYGFNTEDNHDIKHVNRLLLNEYGSIFEGLYSFGEDIFGNQFCFSAKGVFFFNIEIGEKDFLCLTFDEWLFMLENETDYLTGQIFSDIIINHELRLCPKIPFVTGGEYKKENLRSMNFPDYIIINANIARQIYNLPDGTSVTINIV
ncbi:hypothetical protein GN157_12415 [Flavobacterium rakeshii]|uniref:SMI1/KNR4 family protein n=1 Tax=Flavobacterium rakeshii TaxID=1038845 RepID=A0A6N8HFL2_9FLAO|nr:SMI1/KNR4 family protein [Flavobacterium rakeshii]MUV04514.1 hypothetical protein [Flavobacterium rakeshii]